jgi:hypothetical protein
MMYLHRCKLFPPDKLIRRLAARKHCKEKGELVSARKRRKQRKEKEERTRDHHIALSQELPHTLLLHGVVLGRNGSVNIAGTLDTETSMSLRLSSTGAHDHLCPKSLSETSDLARNGAISDDTDGEVSHSARQAVSGGDEEKMESELTRE